MRREVGYDAFVAGLDLKAARRIYSENKPYSGHAEWKFRDAFCRSYPDLADVDVLISRSGASLHRFYYSPDARRFLKADAARGERALAKMRKRGWLDLSEMDGSGEKHAGILLWLHEQEHVLEVCTVRHHCSFWIAMWLVQRKDPLRTDGGGYRHEYRLSQAATQLPLFEAA